MTKIESEYQEQARAFKKGDLAFPLLDGGSPSAPGEVLKVHPEIGMIDLLYGGKETRYPVESLQRLPRSRTALYWADLDRHYRGTKAECESGRYTCPRCREESSILRLVSYKRTQGKNHRLLSCPNCHFLIKPANIIGHPAYDAALEASMKTASGTVTVGVLTLDTHNRSTWEPRYLQEIERSLKRLLIDGVEFRQVQNGRPIGLEIIFDLQDSALLDTLGPKVIRHLFNTLKKTPHFAVFGFDGERDLDYRVDDLGTEVRYAARAQTSTITVRVTVRMEGLQGPFSREDREFLDEEHEGSVHNFANDEVRYYHNTVFERLDDKGYFPEVTYVITGRASGDLEVELQVPDDTRVLDNLERDVLEALANASPFMQRLVFGTSETRMKTTLEVM